MCAMMTVNLAVVPRGRREPSKKPILLLYSQKHVDALWLTLARESRHIVAFALSDTTSRAAVRSFSLVSGVKRLDAKSAPGER